MSTPAAEANALGSVGAQKDISAMVTSLTVLLQIGATVAAFFATVIVPPPETLTKPPFVSVQGYGNFICSVVGLFFLAISGRQVARRKQGKGVEANLVTKKTWGTVFCLLLSMFAIWSYARYVSDHVWCKDVTSPTGTVTPSCQILGDVESFTPDRLNKALDVAKSKGLVSSEATSAVLTRDILFVAIDEDSSRIWNAKSELFDIRGRAAVLYMVVIITMLLTFLFALSLLDANYQEGTNSDTEPPKTLPETRVGGTV